MRTKNSELKIFLVALIVILGTVGPLSNVNFISVPTTEPCNQTDDIDGTTTGMTLYQATTTFSSLVDVTITGLFFAFFWDECINITVVQLTTEDVIISIDLGVKLLPADSGVQTMVIAKEYTITLTSQYQVKTQIVYAFCTESDDGAPSEEDTFTVSSTPYSPSSCVGKILDYFQNVNNTFLGTQIGQFAVWACIDGTAAVSYLAEVLGVTSQVNTVLSESGTGLTLGGGGGGGIPAFDIIMVFITLSPIIGLSILLKKRNRVETFY